MKWKASIAFDGRNFSGFQYQKTGRTIQDEIEKVLGILFEHPVRIQASGRTDAGVHARDMVISFSSELFIPEDRLFYAMNRLLPRDLELKNLSPCDESFNPRFDAKRKHYRYRIAKADDLFQRPYRWHVKETLDLAAMRRAADILEGEHDFYSFSNRRRGEGSTVRKIYSIDLSEEQDEILLDFYGNGFLYKMVRILVFYLVEVGKGNLDPERTEDILKSRSREFTRRVAPAEGLTLMKVHYSD